MKVNNTERFYGMLGFAMRAGRVIIGTDLVCAAMAKKGAKKPSLVLFSSEASDATKKKITAKCEFYAIESLEIDAMPEELGRRLGKSFAPVVLGVADDAFAEEIRRAIK